MPTTVDRPETDFTIVDTPFLLLIPPSEGKEPGGDPGTPWGLDSGRFGADLAPVRSGVVKALRRAGGGTPALLGARGDLLERARAANRALLGAPTLPAFRRYTGVVWENLDLPGLPAPARRSAAKRIVVPSGLLGLSLAEDPVPDYRLKMGVGLAPLGNLAAWWRDDISSVLGRFARGRLVIDLLPQEHRGAIDPGAIPGLVRVDLVAKKGGRVGGHDAKAAKGRLARHLLVGGAPTLARALSSFRHPDYGARIAED